MTLCASILPLLLAGLSLWDLLSQPARPCPGSGDSLLGCQAVNKELPGENCLGSGSG